MNKVVTKNALCSVSKFALMLCLTLQIAHAMDNEAADAAKNPTLRIPDPFPGHQSQPIQGTVAAAKDFDPKDYQQDKLRKEGACQFNSMLAGIMHTPYGRSQVQGLIHSQDDKNVNIKFYFPPSEELKKYDDAHHTLIKANKSALVEIEELLTSEQSEAQQLLYKQEIIEIKDELENKIPVLWDDFFKRSETMFVIPKKFVLSKIKGSFPHNNSNWVNILQQAYMLATKNRLLTFYSHGGYSQDQEIIETDSFTGVPFCELYKGTYENAPTCSNFVHDSSWEPLLFSPLINIPLKQINILIKETGLDLPAIKDIKAERQPNNSFTYTPLTYNNVVDFVHTHGLTKNLLTASNVVKFQTRGHAVALFFGEGKIYYYDNVYYPQQAAIYGTEGPIYEEAKYFKGQSLEVMEEQDFFTRFFQEIYYRLEQAARVRYESAYSKTSITFFRKPLIAQE